MMRVSRQTIPTGLWANEIVADVLSTTVLVLAGIVTVAQFAFY